VGPFPPLEPLPPDGGVPPKTGLKFIDPESEEFEPELPDGVPLPVRIFETPK
jgi:hypothetical protein